MSIKPKRANQTKRQQTIDFKACHKNKEASKP